ncbi:hypothetical protein ES708_11449 [subsurface metagenome]
MSADKKSADKIAFNYLQETPYYWIKKADDLLRVAYKLEPDREPNKMNIITGGIKYVYYMLIGFALECYYKGAIIAKLLKEGNPIYPDELEPRINKHKLEVLAPKAGVKVVGKQQKVLIFLTECIKWRGRYPTPRFASDIDGSIEYYSQNNDDIHVLTTIEPVITIDELHELIDEAGNQIRSIAW